MNRFTVNFLPRQAMFACAVLLLAGCAARLPEYRWRSPNDALRVMSERDRTVRSVRASFRLLLWSPKGRVSLDGALVAEPPHRLRLRAWKLTQAVLDVTVNEDGAFVLDRRGNREPGDAVRPDVPIDLAVLADALTALPGFGGDENWTVRDDAAWDALTARREVGDSDAIVECTIAPKTLTRRACVLRTGGRDLQTLRFDRYRLSDSGVPWPWLIRGRGTHGTFEIRFDEVSFDESLPAAAFRPPKTARRVTDGAS